MSNYWQVAAGSAGRDYSAEFIRFGIAFVGDQPWVDTIKTVNENDRLLLKSGQSKLRAVGRAVARNGRVAGEGDKEWLHDFDGWRLPAYCYVQWHVPPVPVPVRGLTRKTIEGVWLEELRRVAEDGLAQWPQSRVEPEPEPTTPVSDEQMVELLIGRGLRVGAAEELTRTLLRIRRLVQYYYKHPKGWDHIREHETRTFLVVPLLLALGWSEQSIKIEQPTEGGRVDLALFDEPFNGDPTECIALIETKGFAQGLSFAPAQVREYARHFPRCKVLFVTNGYCYKAFVRTGDGFTETPASYMNINKLRSHYPVDPKVPGALDLLSLLMK
jgi:hypothetical protein